MGIAYRYVSIISKKLKFLGHGRATACGGGAILACYDIFGVANTDTPHFQYDLK